MAKQQRKEKNAWDRFLLWAEENQKVIWVVLLIIIAPSFAMTGLFTQVLAPKADSLVAVVVDGKSITQAEYRRMTEAIGTVESVLISIARSDYNPLPGPLAASGLSWGAMDVTQFYAYRGRALKMGIRVPDDELRQYIRDLWQRQEALKRAREDLRAKPQPKPEDQNAAFQMQIEHMMLTRKKLDELRAGDGSAFDEAGWTTFIEGAEIGRTRILVQDFEETLRDFCLIAKLEHYVTSSIQVSPQEVFELYNKEKARRKLSWAELKVPDALKEKFSKSLTPDELKTYYETSKDKLKRDLSIRSSWLLLPKDHFKAEAEKGITDDDLRKYYQDNRNSYRKPVILSTESDFALRKAEEKAALDAQVYKPFDEVKDKVREKVIEERARTNAQMFSGQLSQRIYPPKPPADAAKAEDKPAVSFDELVKEFPYLKTGTVSFADQKKAKEAFGVGYTSMVDSWFRTAQANRPISSSSLKAEGENGQVFYTKPDVRPSGYLPALKDIEAEVRNGLAVQKALEAIEKAAKAASEDANTNKKDLAAVSAAGLDVEIAGEKVHVDAFTPQGSGTYVVKEGSLMVPKKKPEKPVEKTPAVGDEDSDENAEEEAHPASKAIVEAVFRLPEGDKQKTTVVSDAETSSCYIVRFEDVQLPNPGGFEQQKDQLERQLVQEKSQQYFTDWRAALLKEARA
jgi:hypothetical protein